MKTKTHYEKVANLINSQCGARSGLEHIQIAVNLSYIYESDNPRFDKHRFLTACGLAYDKENQQWVEKGDLE